MEQKIFLTASNESYRLTMLGRKIVKKVIAMMDELEIVVLVNLPQLNIVDLEALFRYNLKYQN